MPSAYSLVTLFLALFISFTFGETEVKFIGQTEFVVNETSTTVIRLVIERTGEPVNVTAIVSVRKTAFLHEWWNEGEVLWLSCRAFAWHAGGLQDQSSAPRRVK